MKNVIIKNCDFKLNDSLFIIEGKNFNITDSYIHNQSSFTTGSRGTNPIIFSGMEITSAIRNNGYAIIHLIIF